MENKEILSDADLETTNIEIISIQTICRLCASQNERLISVYSEEGKSNDLETKINLYLPIKIAITDDLPLQCCWNCATTLLAWHDLVLTTAESDRKFRSNPFLQEKNIAEEFCAEPDPDEGDPSKEETESTDTQLLNPSLNDFCQTEDITEQNKKPSKSLKRKRKQEIQPYFPSEDTSPIETYISGMEQHFIVDPELETNDYKIDIQHEIVDEIDVKTDVKDVSNDSDKETNYAEELTSYYPCQFCSHVFVEKEEILSHLQAQHEGKEFDDPMPVIGNQLVPERSIKKEKEKRRNTKIDTDITNAAKVVVDGRIYYNCKECGKSLHSPYTYIWHMRIHTGERPFVCDLCGKQFRVSQGLVRHLRETHEGIKKFPCDLCGRMFATRRNVEEHRRIHTNERPYVCDLCGKAFKQKASLFVHKRSHKNYFPFKCSYCNQGFRTKPPLMVHITRHTGEKPYKCDICGRCFRIKYELKRHRLIHSDEKPFVCNLCGLSFRQKRYLRNHAKSNHSLVDSL